MIYFTAHTFKCVCHCRRAMFRVLGMYNFDIYPISSFSYICYECILVILCELSFCSAQFLLENWFSIHSGMDTRWDPERQRKAEFSYFFGRNSGRKSWRVSKEFCSHLQNFNCSHWTTTKKTAISALYLWDFHRKAPNFA